VSTRFLHLATVCLVLAMRCLWCGLCESDAVLLNLPFITELRGLEVKKICKEGPCCVFELGRQLYII
jgi:hypothetical protein